MAKWGISVTTSRNSQSNIHHINIQETKISRYIQQQRQLIQQNIQNDFKTAIHKAIQEYIEPLMENSKLTGDNVLLSIKTMQNDIVQDIK